MYIFRIIYIILVGISKYFDTFELFFTHFLFFYKCQLKYCDLVKRLENVI